LGRVGTPKDIAGIALFLASELLAYVTAGPYLSVVDYPSRHTVLLLVVRNAGGINKENRSANSLELVTLQVIMAHFS
jgi:hypothetical protein